MTGITFTLRALRHEQRRVRAALWRSQLLRDAERAFASAGSLTAMAVHERRRLHERLTLRAGIVAVAFACAVCGGIVPSVDLVAGDYVLDHGYGTEELRLTPDGRFVQIITIHQPADRVVHEGRWWLVDNQIALGGVADGQVRRLEGVEDGRSTKYAWKVGLGFMEVRRSWCLGSVVLVQNPDAGLAFRRR